MAGYLLTWFVARVSVLPALMLTLPYSVLLVFTFNILLSEFGAADFSGTSAAIGTVNQIGPIVTVLAVITRRGRHRHVRRPRRSHDPGRTRRLAGNGINPIQALVVPGSRVATTVALALFRRP